jgi:glycosyltransferase involved in cell wall biosynthesis
VNKKIILVSRCAWTLYNFRSGLMRALKNDANTVIGGGAVGDGFESEIEALGVKFKGLSIDKKGINPQADIKLLLTLYRWYKKERPDIVHHFTIKPVIYGTVAARLAGVPKIVNTITGLGYVFTHKKMVWLRRIVKMLYRFSLRFADFTFFQNQDDFVFFLSHGLVEKHKAGLVPGSGVNCNHFFPIDILNLKKTTPSTFLMVSRVLKDKGVYEFVEAAGRVKKFFPDSEFQLLGMRDIRNPNVVPESDLKIWNDQKSISWLGEVKDVRPVIADVDVVVLPSFYREGIPRALLEAAAMGKPIITTDAIGCREVVDNEINGLLIPVKDAVALSQAMLRMIKNPKMRRSMGRAGRRKMLCEFDEKIVIDETLKVYSL